MNNFKLSTAAIALSLIATPVMSAPITVDGITWDAGSAFDFIAQNDFFTTDVNVVGDEARGIGRINSINAETGFAAGELTYVFEDFIATSVVGDNAKFSGGTVSFYSDATADFDAMDATTAADGNLWLELTAYDWDGDGDTLDVILFSAIANGFAEGAFNVSGGAAAGNFDTNGLTLFGNADLSFTGSWQQNPGAFVTANGLAHFGTTELKGNSIPEPSPLALMLLVLGLFAASKVKGLLKSI